MRNTNSFYVLILILFASAQLKASPSVPPEDTIKMQHIKAIMITAEKRVKELNDIPASITTLQAENISTAQTQSVREISSHVPNLFIPDYGMKMSAPVIIRGIGSKLSAPTVGLYVDGISYFEKESFSFELFDIKRVEVLRGPQGTLFGRNALGGIINIVTHKPNNTPSLKINGTYGGYNLQRYQLAGNTPIVKDKLFIRAAANYTSRDGYFKNAYNNKYIDHQKDFNGRAQLRFTPIKNFNLLYTFEGNITNDGGYPYRLATSQQDDPYTINYDGDSYFTRDYMKNSLKMDYEFTNMVLSSVSGLQHSNYEQNVDQDFTAQKLYYVNHTNDEQTFTEELNLKSKNNDAFEWVVGTFGFYQDLENVVDVTYGDDFFAKYPFPEDYEKIKANDRINQGAAVYGQLNINELIPGFEFTLGTRYDIEESHMNYTYNKVMNGATNQAQKLDTSVVSQAFLPKFSAAFKLMKNQKIYFTTSKGYRAGGFNTTFDKPDEMSYEPEYTWNYEVGIKGKFSNQKLRYSFAAFYIDWFNQQIYQVRESGQGSMIKNVGHSYSQGLEAELSAYLLNNLSVNIGMGYTEARFIDHKDPNDDTDYSDNRVPMVPNFTGNLAVDYTIPLQGDFLNGIKIGGSIRGVGEHYWDEANALKQGAYALLKSDITLKTKHFNLTFWGKNITDKRYKVYEFSAFGSNYHQYGSPRVLGASLSFNLSQ